jgi:membrane protein DedA with SNARE-associated domain
MGHSAGGFATLCAVSLAVSLAVHLRTQKFLVACLLSAIISSLLFELVEVLTSGYLDPFFAIALVNSTFLALGISVVVGRLLVILRRRRRRDSGDT